MSGEWVIADEAGYQPAGWIQEELESLDSGGLRRVRRTVKPLPDGRCEVEGRVLWNFAGNDYLNLAGDMRVVEAARFSGLQRIVRYFTQHVRTVRCPWRKLESGRRELSWRNMDVALVEVTKWPPYK